MVNKFNVTLFQKIGDGEYSSAEVCVDSSTTSALSSTDTNKNNMSCLAVTLEQVSYCMQPSSRSISPTNDPSNYYHSDNAKREKYRDSCLTATDNDISRSSTIPTVTFDSTAGFWHKAPHVYLELDYPESQGFQTSVADTNKREIDENGEETQSYAWANPPEFEL